MIMFTVKEKGSYSRLFNKDLAIYIAEAAF